MLELAIALVRAWTWLYTCRLDPNVRDSRRLEIESDLWESQADGPRDYASRRIAAQMLVRLLVGIPDDLLWRLEHRHLEESSMDLHIKKVWLPGAAACLLFFGFYWVLVWLPFDKNRFQFLAIPYLVLPFAGALAAYWSRRMKGSVLERILSALFPVFAFVALFAVRIVFGLFFEGEPFTLPHFLAGFSVTLVFIVAGGLLLVLGAWPFCRPHLREQVP